MLGGFAGGAWVARKTSFGFQFLSALLISAEAMYIFALACGSPLHFVGVAQVTENWIVGETNKVKFVSILFTIGSY